MIAENPSKGRITKTIIKDYEPAPVYIGANGYYNWRQKPPFQRMYHVPAMLQDPRVQMNLMLIKGMIVSLSRFYINESDEDDENPSEGKKFVMKNVERWWRCGASKMLTAIEWGFYGAEVLYRTDKEGRVCFDHFNHFKQQDVWPVLLDGKYAGNEVRNRDHIYYVGGEKAFWHTHWREKLRWWGGSRLEGAYDPWLQKHDEGGAIDVRRLYNYKEVFQGDTLYHPPGDHVDAEGQRTPNAKIARALVTKMRAGGQLVLPAVFDEVTKQRLWSLESRQKASMQLDVDQACRSLDREISEGMGVSEELHQAAESGSGYSGRKVPETSTRGMLTETVFWLVQDADEQIFRPLYRREFDDEPDYEIIPFGLVRDEEDDDVHNAQVAAGNASGATMDRNAQSARAIGANQRIPKKRLQLSLSQICV